MDCLHELVTQDSIVPITMLAKQCRDPYYYFLHLFAFSVSLGSIRNAFSVGPET